MEKRNELLTQVLQIFKKYGAEHTPVKLLHVRDESNQTADAWNDYLIHLDKDNNVWVSLGTTDPGNHAYTAHPEGAAHMMLGFHKEIWVIDTHAANNPAFAHEALCSRPARGCNGIKYYRDANKNRIYDNADKVLNNFVGINCHRASKIQDVPKIGLYSEGCQVRRNATAHLQFIRDMKNFDVVKSSVKGGIYTYRFSCLLVTNKEFII